MRGPTPDECSRNAILTVDDKTYLACWYPSMGGYVGRCLVKVFTCSGREPRPDDGFDAYVWHDGEFAFADGDREPTRLHHCDPAGFVCFGELILRTQQELLERGSR